MAKRKTPKKTGVKSLHLPTFISYLVAGMGAIFVIILLGYLYSQSGSSEQELDPGEKRRWESAIDDFKRDGTLLSFESDRDKKGEGSATVEESKWNVLVHDSKEAMCLAVAKTADIKVLLVRSGSGKHLATYRRGGSLYENKE